PTLTAMLYDPCQPVHEHMSILDTKKIARMYRSEKIPIHDDRVLISGSDPPDDRFPRYARFRVRIEEIFLPPHLISGLAQPTFTLPDKEW
ncbi:hypothetical protein BKA62DRAFT_587652, partial [Auriculariales sp. MPI-PUGE-AT-0066]